MNKRLLRKYADMSLPMNKNSGVMFVREKSFIVRSAVKNIGGRRFLLLFFYPREAAVEGNAKARFIVFQTRDDYLTLERTQDDKLKWRVSTVNDLRWEKYCSMTGASLFYSMQDNERVCRFCKQIETDGFLALSRLQNGIFNEKCRRRKLQRERRIRSRMAGIPEIPQTVRKWAENEVFPAHFFYEYHKGRKKQIGYCTCCKADVAIEGVRHAKQGICPACGRTVTFHAVGRMAKVYDRLTIQFMQRRGDELLLRICKAIVSYEKDYRKPRINIWESARFFIPCDTSKEVEPYYNDYGTLTPWHKGVRPARFIWSENYLAVLYGYLYTCNLHKVLDETPWQYSQIKEFYEHDREPMEVIPYLMAYLRYPVVENLVKLRLSRLASDVVYLQGGASAIDIKGRNVCEVLKLPAEHIPVLQELNAGTKVLQLMRGLCQRQIRFSKDLIQWCRESDIHRADDLAFCLQFISAHRLMRYIDEQHEKLKTLVVPFGHRPYVQKEQVFSQYKDYLRFCSDLEYDTKSDFILYPRNIKDAHDRASEMMDKRKNEIYNKKISDAYAVLEEQYGLKKYGLVMMAPRTAEEIVKEGHELRHCVGGYISRVANSECVILFLRQSKSPNAPFYTVELRNNQIMQIRGELNCDPNEKVKRFLRAWEKEKLAPALKAA